MACCVYGYFKLIPNALDSICLRGGYRRRTSHATTLRSATLLTRSSQTPLGALSVVVCAILSSIFLNEKLTFFGWLGCALCIVCCIYHPLIPLTEERRFADWISHNRSERQVLAHIVDQTHADGVLPSAMSPGPQEPSVGQINAFRKLFLAPGFLVYGSLVIAGSLTIIFYFAPRYGKKSMLWYILVCSSIGGISVSVTTGLGAAIVQTALGDNQVRLFCSSSQISSYSSVGSSNSGSYTSCWDSWLSRSVSVFVLLC